MVALTVETRLPPAMVKPPVVIRRSRAFKPPASVLVATLFWEREPAVRVRPWEEERPAALIPPEKDEEAEALEVMAPVPVRVRPLLEERPAVVTPPAKVEEP